MGYTTNKSIVNFWPDDTKDKIYISNTYNMSDLNELIKEKFGDSEVEISTEHIHCWCTTYDLHCPGDWVTFIVIERINNV